MAGEGGKRQYWPFVQNVNVSNGNLHIELGPGSCAMDRALPSMRLIGVAMTMTDAWRRFAIGSIPVDSVPASAFYVLVQSLQNVNAGGTYGANTGLASLLTLLALIAWFAETTGSYTLSIGTVNMENVPVPRLVLVVLACVAALFISCGLMFTFPFHGLPEPGKSVALIAVGILFYGPLAVFAGIIIYGVIAAVRGRKR